MSENLVDLVDDIVAPVCDMVASLDPDGFVRWKEAIIERLKREESTPRVDPSGGEEG